MNASTLPASCPALVVGAGPVGLALAAHLHHHGLPCRLIDKAPAPSDKSRALVLWGRSLEMLDDLGLVDNFLAAGMLINGARLYGGSRLLVNIASEPAGTAYPRPLMLAQNETERLLTEHLRRVGIPVERSVELTGFVEHGDGVTANLHHADGRQEQVRCGWLLGCDGAHSTLRKQLGMDFSGEAEPNDWVLADCRVEGPIPQDELSLFWHHKGVLAFFPFARNRCRVIADMGPAHGADRPPEPSLAHVQAIVNERGPTGVRLSESHWLSGFRINERKVAHYSRGRVFLAGDAAHIHSPAGGQGMNTGMQDAWNLAWKLALVQAGRAKASPLLDSYSEERSAVGEEVLRQAGRLTRVATLRNPLAQFLRNHLVALLGRLPPFRHTFVRYLSEMAVHYPHSPLNGESESGWASGSIRPGDRVPDANLREMGTGSERRLLTLLRGPRHHLLLLPAAADPADPARLAEVARQTEASYPGLIQSHLIVPGESSLSLPDGLASAWLGPGAVVCRHLGTRETAVALVRPDGYLGYRGQPADAEGLLGHLARYLVARPPAKG
jgi:2-polyprenyl-6-methoxyphenol hydroxylase-like FAD-dependent oxidoreductase